MALVTVKGTFINASLKPSTYEGKTTYSTQVDVYQNESPRNDKMVSIKVEEADLLNKFQNEYAMGDEINLTCSVSSYKNNTYFKFLNFA